MRHDQVVGPTPHVLIVEDDANTADALRILFHETGHRVSVAYTLASAFTTASTDAPDLMLLDLTLPDGDGLEVLERLRTAGAPFGTVIALTGHDGLAVAEECRASGCTEVLMKPVSIRELLRKAPAWIAAGRSG